MVDKIDQQPFDQDEFDKKHAEKVVKEYLTNNKGTATESGLENELVDKNIADDIVTSEQVKEIIKNAK